MEHSMQHFRKKSTNKVWGHSTDYAKENLPSRDKKAIPNNFENRQEALNDPLVFFLKNGDYIEIADWLYEIIITPLDGGGHEIDVAEVLTPISFQESKDFLKTLIPLEDQLKHIYADIVRQHLDAEMKKDIYFYGLGFELGRESVAMFPNEPDAIRLTAWHKATLIKEKELFDAVRNGIIGVDDIMDNMSYWQTIDDF